MQIIILGAGQVGSSLAENLILDGHDITIVDLKEDRLQDLQEHLDLRTIAGHCSYPEVLRRAGANDADMVIAVTASDEANMLACQVAYSLFHTPTKIARIRSPHYLIRKELFGKDNVPIDVFISPEQLVTNQIQQLIQHPGTLQVLDFAAGKVKLVAIKPYYGGTLVGKKLSELNEQVQSTARVVAIYRNEHAVPIDNKTTIELGDEVFFITASESIQLVMTALRREEEPYKNVIITGGGYVGRTLAKTLDQEYQVKLIDHNRKRCERLAEILDNTTVLYGDACDPELLSNENIDHTDVFCATTDDDEANIISALQAKRLGAKLVLPLVTRTAYIDLIEGSNINIAISPQQATVSAILTQIRKGDIETVYSLRHGAAEAIEAVAHGDKTTSKVVGHILAEIKLPKGTIIGAIARGDQIIIPDPMTKIESEDHIVLFVGDKRQIPNVEKLFQVSATFF